METRINSIVTTLLIFNHINLVFGNLNAGNPNHFTLRDIKFSPDYNQNELPPTPDGKPVLVSILMVFFKTKLYSFIIEEKPATFL